MLAFGRPGERVAPGTGLVSCCGPREGTQGYGSETWQVGEELEPTWISPARSRLQTDPNTVQESSGENPTEHLIDTILFPATFGWKYRLPVNFYSLDSFPPLTFPHFFFFNLLFCVHVQLWLPS